MPARRPSRRARFPRRAGRWTRVVHRRRSSRCGGAQLEVWVQESVVTAIAEVNNSAADGLRRKQIDPWVGNLPIKDVRSIQTSQYYVKEGLPQESSKSDKDRAYPSADKAEAFTGRESDDLFELMHFAVRLVVDARDLPQVLAGLSAQRFHVPLSIRYEKLEPNVAMEGKIYGEDPVVLLTAEFETVLFSELYLPLMPQTVLDELGKKRPEPEKESGA
jgi:hypothetical protein